MLFLYFKSAVQWGHLEASRGIFLRQYGQLLVVICQTSLISCSLLLLTLSAKNGIKNVKKALANHQIQSKAIICNGKKKILFGDSKSSGGGKLPEIKKNPPNIMIGPETNKWNNDLLPGFKE